MIYEAGYAVARDCCCIMRDVIYGFFAVSCRRGIFPTQENNSNFRTGVLFSKRRSRSRTLEDYTNWGLLGALRHEGAPIGKRVRYTFMDGPSKDEKLCRVIHANDKLWGGALVGGCGLPELHPRLPHREKFKFVSWEELDPLKNLALIRATFTTLSERDDSYNRKHFSWEKIGPIVKLALENGNLRLKRAVFPIIQGGPAIPVYTISILPHDQCLKEDGSLGETYTASHTTSNGEEEDEFNHRGSGGDPFFYGGDIYFGDWSDGESQQVVKVFSYGTKDHVASYGPVCEFELPRSP